MAVGYVTPLGLAQDIDALAVLLAAKPNISAAVEVIDVPDVMLGRMAVKVTGTAIADITNAVDGVAEVSTIDWNDATAGNGTITVDAQTTANVLFDATAADVKTALELLSSVTSVTVTGVGSVADPYIVTFADLVTHAVSITDFDLTGGPGNIVETTAGITAVPNCVVLEGTTPA